MNHLNSVLSQIEVSLQPTCLLTKETAEEDTIRLTWYSHNSTSASLNGEPISLSGTKLVYPTETTIYTFKVIGKYGKSEDRVTVEIEAEEPNPEEGRRIETQPDPPVPPVDPPQPIIKRTPVTVNINRFVVYEDGSSGATDWSFTIYLGQTNLMLLPKRSYHDDERKVVQPDQAFANGIVQGDDVIIRVTGYNFDDRKTAEGSLTIPLESFSRSTQVSVEVTVHRNPKKGNFVFYLTVIKQN
jgi:hypothetical protein